MQTKAAEATEARGLPGLCAGGYLGRTQALAEGCGGDGRGQNAAVGEKQKGAGMRGFLPGESPRCFCGIRFYCRRCAACQPLFPMCRFSIAQGCGGWQGGGGGRESAGLRVSSAGAFPRLCQRRMANGLRRKSRRCRAPACRRSGHAFVEMEEGAEDPSHAMRSGGVHAARSGCRPLSPSCSGGRFAHRKMAFFRRPDAPAALQATDRRQGFVDGLKDGYAIRWLGCSSGLG